MTCKELFIVSSSYTLWFSVVFSVSGILLLQYGCCQGLAFQNLSQPQLNGPSASPVSLSSTTHCFSFTTTHVAGKHYLVADAIPCFNLQKFHLSVPHAASAATPIMADRLEELHPLIQTEQSIHIFSSIYMYSVCCWNNWIPSRSQFSYQSSN